jgi:2-polyprenyl-3-methyl-5-hydroxy-6-metoxy-1,4-benzoquinol methylase
VVDKSTLEYYATNASEVALRYESVSSALSSLFELAFIKGGKVLDIGSGSGRDLSVMAQQGFNVYGVDPTSQLVEIAQIIHPELAGRVKVGSLPTLDIPFDGEFDGILCCAVLMHLDEIALEESIIVFRSLLRMCGRLLISVPTERSDVNQNERDQNGRLFKNYSSAYLVGVLELQGFQLLEEWRNADALKRTGVEWLTQLYQLSS